MAQNSVQNLNKIVVIAIAALLVGIGGTVAYFKLTQKQTPSPNQSQTTPAAVSSPQPAEIANWETYSNNQLGFQIKYPKEMGFETGADLAVNILGPDAVNAVVFEIVGPTQQTQTDFHDGLRFTIALVNNPKNLSLKDYADQQTAPDPLVGGSRLSFNTINIDSKVGYKAEVKSDISRNTHIYLPASNPNQVIQFLIYHGGARDSDYINIIDNMLSSFKFTS